MTFLNGNFNHEDNLKLESLDLVHRLPLYVDINPSGECNQSCRWCIGINKNIQQCSLSEKILLRAVDDIHNMRVSSLVFDGFYGDPLMNIYTLGAIERATRYNKCVGLGTNGMLIDREASAIIVNITYIRISVDSYDNDIYNRFKGTRGNNVNRILDNVDFLVNLKRRLRKNIRIGLSFMLQSENIHSLENTIETSKKMGIDYVQFKSDLLHGDSLDVIGISKEINEHRKKYEDVNFSIFCDIFATKARSDQCFIPYFIPVIGPDGNVYTCCENSYKPEYSYGNIYQNNLYDIWFGERKDNMTKKIDTKGCEVCSRHNWRINRFVKTKLEET